MLAETMIEKLNAQINLEFYSSNLYLQMSAWCDDKGLEGTALMLRGHAAEEMQHMQRLFTYVSETGALPILGSIAAPPFDFASLKELFSEIYKHECLVTEQINKLVQAAFSTSDYSTFNFLQWYVAEQHEEEKLFKSILDRIQLVGEDGKAMFWVDRELADLAKNASSSIMGTPE
jgi:ferritin